jgi:hypothetical protein
MADTFAPKLGSSIGYEAPVAQAQVGTALAGLSSAVFRSSGKAAAPTSEEKFGAAWTQYTKRLQDQGMIDEDQVFTAGTASLSQLRQFGSLFPQFSDDVFTRAGAEKNAELEQVEAQQSGQNAIITKYYTTGEGQIADARARQLRAEGLTDQADEVEAKSYADFVQRQAETNKIAERAKTTGDLTTLSNDTWSVNKKAIRSQADIAANGLSEMLVAFKASPTGSFDIEEMGLGNLFTAFPNLSITSVTKDNFGEFALQLKSEILRTQRLRIGNEVGFELRQTPAGYEDEVFKGFDAIVAWSEKDLDPAEIVKRAKNEGFLRMQESGIPVGDLAAVELVTSDPAIQNTILSTFTGDIIDYLKTVPEGSAARMAAMQGLATDSMKDARNHFSRMLSIYSGNSTDAKPYPEVTMSARQAKIRDNMLGLVESHSQIDKRTGKPQRFNTAAWDEYFAKNAESIIQIASQDSDFATTVGTALTNDIMLDIKKIQEVTQDKGVTISFNKKGQVEFGVDKEELISQGIILSDEEAAVLKERSDNGDMLARQRLQDYSTESNLNESAYITRVVGPEGSRNTTANLDDINYKWNVLNQLGQVGSSVKSIINQESAAKPTQSAVNTAVDLPRNANLVDVGGNQIAANSSMSPLITDLKGASKKTVKGADQAMASLLSGPFQTLQSTFGKTLVINDAIAKAGTSREGNTPNSRHFHGDAIDIDISGFSNEERIKLVDSAIQAGFQGFGFGNNILHIDMGQRRAWNYSNDTFGGQPVADLITRVKGTNVARPSMTTQASAASAEKRAMETPEVDPNEGAPTNFTLLIPDIQVEELAPVSSEEIVPDSTPQGEAMVGDQGMVRVVNSPVFDRDMQRFLQMLKVDMDQAFAVADLDELEAAEAEGKLKKGDKVVVGAGAEAFVVEIE